MNNGNNLKSEKSPYLLQHADNPVYWKPWGDAAFEQAKHEDKPIFLSIGYSTCHWCHVMEKESFEDEQVASLLNRTFVCIKVDREERPDIDSVYMDVVQALTGAGGWPMTVVMTPEKKPFFAATYIPKEDKFGRVGLLNLIPRIQQVWNNERERVDESAESIVNQLIANETRDFSDMFPGKDVLDKAFDVLKSNYDEKHGGFNESPKFPSPHNLLFLLRYWKRTGKEKGLDMALHTLTEMRRGGMYDQVGFGFHRYSTDRFWLVPHFEKMLYDQALLAIAYLEAYEATGRDLFAQTAREILTYVAENLTDEKGAFHSAEDADSEGVEGKYYVWRWEELEETLGPEEMNVLTDHMTVSREGNFHEAGFEGDGINVLALHKLFDADGEKRRWEEVRNKLHRLRSSRTAPFKDDKILTDWNGLMIAAFAQGFRLLGDSIFRERAEQAARFVFSYMVEGEDNLLHMYRDGAAMVEAKLDDYAFLGLGCLRLFEATFIPFYLERAVALAEKALQLFWDTSRGGFYLTKRTDDELFLKEKPHLDMAIPSGNSVMYDLFTRLGRLTGNQEFEQTGEEIGKSLSKQIAGVPYAHTYLLAAIEENLARRREVVVVGWPEAEQTKKMLDFLNHTYMPGKIVLVKSPHESRNEEQDIASLVPHLAHYKMINNETTVYVCENFACQRPVTDLESLKELLA